MDGGLQKAFDAFSSNTSDLVKKMSSSSSSFVKSSSSIGGGRGGGVGAGAVVDRAGGVLVNRPAPRQVVSLLTCSKLCGICFVAGIVIGFTLKRRVKRWATKLLKKIKDD